MLPELSEETIHKVVTSKMHIRSQYASETYDQHQASENNSTKTNKHFPDSVKASIKHHSLRRKSNIQGITPRLPSGLQRVRAIDMVKCGICEGQYLKAKMALMCECAHPFCKACLDSYVKYRIGVFERISCPDQDCDQLISQKGEFFLKLDIGVRKKYIKINQFYLTRMNPRLRVCPLQSCEDGIIEMPQDTTLREEVECKSCKSKFCSNCFLPPHSGECDSNNVNYYEHNLKFKQCNNCKMVVERSEGCVHMTCRCGYQFCYVCGTKWSDSHTCFDFEQHQNECQEFANCPMVIKAPMKLMFLIGALILAMLQLGMSIIYFALLIPLFLLFSLTCGTVSLIINTFEDSPLLGLLLVILFPVAILIALGIYGWQFLMVQFADIFRQSFLCIFVMFYDILTF